jgi:hypothetical protein
VANFLESRQHEVRSTYLLPIRVSVSANQDPPKGPGLRDGPGGPEPYEREADAPDTWRMGRLRKEPKGR